MDILQRKIQGRKILYFENTNLIDVSNLQSGLYITRIQTEDGLQVSNFIKK
ncbi:T9SS type A sorting domain-containing protein [Flavobacterium sp.]|uniref:T9SS type A sorting domain-containing protein n=1 Tax=Flavobacterium sp. TaxID=239 RepID=UPI0037508D08